MRSRFAGSLFLLVAAPLGTSCVDKLVEPGAPPPTAPGAPSSVVVDPAEATLDVGGTVQLVATVRDAQDAVLDVAVSWSSSDPEVAAVSESGLVGARAPGSARITAQAGSASGTSTVQVRNAPPSVTITAPAGGTVREGTTITFQGSASDPEDGDLTASLAWTSDRDGGIGSGGTFQRSDLSVGVHRIVASVTDGHGLTTSDTASLTVEAPPPNATPTVTVHTPSDGTVVQHGATVTFSGSASDPEDGDLTASLAWTSDRDGRIGTGASFRRSDLSVGVHQVVASVTDKDGLTAAATTTLRVQAPPPNAPPTVSILSPSDGSVALEGSPVAFIGSASDPEDGALSGGSVVWTSDRDGQIGTGLSFARSDLSVGAHVITATATDSEGARASDSARLTVQAAAKEAASLTLSPDFLILDQGSTRNSPFTPVVRDAAGAPIPGAPVSWASSDAGTVAVSGSGDVSGVKSGQADVVATSGPASDRAKVVVAGPTDLVGTALVGGVWRASVSPGAEFAVPVVLDMTRVSPNGDLGEVRFDLVYPKSLLSARRLAAGAGFEIENDDQNWDKDKVEVHLEADDPIGQGVITLAVITFLVKNGATPGAEGALRLDFRDRLKDTGEEKRYAEPITVGGRVLIR